MDQGNPDDTTIYGADVAPNGPVQDMYAIDILAGQAGATRASGPAAYTGGNTETGLGGQAEGLAPGGTGPNNTLYQRRGF